MTAPETVLTAFFLASSRHLDEARDLLRGATDALSTEDGLDLLARLELRLDNEPEARRLWTQAVETGVGGRRSRRALDALDSIAWRHRRLIRNLRRGFAFGISALAGLLVGFVLGQCRMTIVPKEECLQQERRFLQDNECVTPKVETGGVPDFENPASTP